MKKRILFCGEASFLNTGFSTYYRELLPRLAKTGKYEIAEFGSYASSDDPRVKSFINGRWKFYGNMPENDGEAQAYQQVDDPAQPGQNTNQFGKYKFDKVVLDFKPDFVIDIRDWWMLAYQQRSSLRDLFKWIIMPTVDSIPQKEEWIATYLTADYVAAYSDFGIDSLRRTAPGLEVRFDPPGKELLGIDTHRKPGRVHPIPLRPGVDLELFKLSNKSDLRAKWGLNPENPIILLVQRNQARKRIAEAIQAFSLMKQKHKGNKMVDKAIMLLHTAWPDNIMSVDYPRLLMRMNRGYHGLPYQRKQTAQEVLNTFMCHNPNCGHVFVAHAALLWNSQQTNFAIQCQKCGQISARTPNTSVGLSREQLSEIYGMSDILLQMSIAEGCGMPVQEAKACGTMVLVTDYAAISEKGKLPNYEHVDRKSYTTHKGGETIEVSYLYEEPETTCWRAHTSIEDAADKMAKYLMNQELLTKTQREARECAEQNYDWDKNVKEWEFILDRLTPKDRAKTWDKPLEIIDVDSLVAPVGASDQDFIVWCYTQILKQDVDPKGFNDWMGTIQYHVANGKKSEEARGMVEKFFKDIIRQRNHTELLRTGTGVGAVAKADPSKGDVINAVVV